MKKQLKDLIRVLFFNGVGLVLGFIIAIVLPTKLTVSDYGYWQIYYFYSSYVGLFMLGFSDGIHLKYAGIDYKDLDKKLFRAYFQFVFLLSIIGFILFTTIIMIFLKDSNRIFAMIMTGINIILFNMNGFFLHVNQISSRFKFYSWGILMDRLLFVIFLMPMFILPNPNFKICIIINLFARLLTLAYNFKTSFNIAFGEKYSFINCYSEIVDNIKVGIYLTISSIVAMLLISYPRIMIDKHFGINEFGMFSFAYSILSIAIQVVIAISTVLYPMLKKIETEKYEVFNRTINNFVLILGSIMLLAYYPISRIISIYIPKYSPILEYLYLLFPMMIYQSKNNIVISTFYKAMRLEKQMLFNNILGLVINAFITYFVFFQFGTIKSIVASSVLCYLVWNHIVEDYLLKKFSWNRNNRFLDVYIIIGFVVCSQISNLFISFTTFTLYLAIVSFIYKKSLVNLIISIRRYLVINK